MRRGILVIPLALPALRSASRLELNLSLVQGQLGLLVAWLCLGLACLKLWEVVAKPLWYYRLRPATSFEAFRGEWAVVTGASRGLGRGYALGLAKRGINVVLMSRNWGALQDVARECQSLGVKTAIMVADFFTDQPEELYPMIEARIRELDKDVSILVNNVGGAPGRLQHDPMPSYCEDYSYVSYESFWRANAVPSLCMTQMLLRGMVRRRKGYILNVSSINGLQACPYLSPYSAAKAYVSSLSACLGNELRGRKSGVWVDCVCPGPVATDGIGRSGLASSQVPDPVIFADQSLALARTPFATVPWPRHWWSNQSLGPNSLFWSTATADKRLYEAMDFSRHLGPSSLLSPRRPKT